MNISKLFPTTLLLVIAMLTVGAGLSAKAASAGRTTLSLDGQWQIADGKSPDEIPADFTHTVPVPGLAHLASPPFPDVDRFISRERVAGLISRGQAPQVWMTNYWNGKVEQDRNYFWYRKTFRAPSARALAMLKISKAQFGTAVWLNGQPLTPENDAWHGEYPGCFTASFWNVTRAIRWDAGNTLLVRIGAHPAVLPGDFPTGSDFEKTERTPGIYDDVSVSFSDNPAIRTIQVAPRIASGEIVVQTTVKNYSDAACSGSLSYAVKAWKTGEPVAATNAETDSLQPGEEKVLIQTIKIPQAHLWCPEDPFLYVLETGTGGDRVQTRFGMRELRFDPATQRAYLNGRVYYLRGSNIALHRFFEDPECGNLPWDGAWVRRLLGTVPKEMHWNYFRFTIGPVPQHWLDVCDEEGLMVQYEFAIWTGWDWYKKQGLTQTYDADETVRQFKDWMADNWNHPSVVVWDAANETRNEMLNATVVPAVRGLDLSGRPWEDSYNPPGNSGDVEEFHGYFFDQNTDGKVVFKMSDLESMDGKPVAVGFDTPVPSTTNAVIINEYDGLWARRDEARASNKKIYSPLTRTNVTVRERLDDLAYVVADLTEFWRAHRQMAGVDYFVYLTSSISNVPTSDNWSDLKRLKLDPAFVDYVGEAFKPLGVYINFFQPTLPAGAPHEFLVKLINDYAQPVAGKLRLTLETKQGKTLATAEQPFDLEALGARDISITLSVPDQPQANLIVKATAMPDRKTGVGPTMSRRWVALAQGSSGH
ncbi:MAG: glycoside hydrolase family 2 TIM barrel-domain containing protein [Verrucomicrobiota bacterium]